MQIYISRRMVVTTLMIIAIILGIAHTISMYATHILEIEVAALLEPRFNLNKEGNIPTFYASTAMLISASLFGIIALDRKSKRKVFWKQWASLALVILFLAIDEAAQIHELFDNDALLAGLETTGLLAWPWVIPYIGLVILFGFAYLKFFLHLPRKYQALFAASAFIYVMSAIGLEMVGAYVYELAGQKTPFYVLLFSIEEMLEIFSVIILIYGLLLYIEQEVRDFNINFVASR